MDNSVLYKEIETCPPTLTPELLEALSSIDPELLICLSQESDPSHSISDDVLACAGFTTDDPTIIPDSPATTTPSPLLKNVPPTLVDSPPSSSPNLVLNSTHKSERSVEFNSNHRRIVRQLKKHRNNYTILKKSKISTKPKVEL